MEQIVSFPGFGWELHFSNVAFRIAGHPIYWYGIIIVAGFLLAMVYASVRAPQVGIKSEDMTDLAIIALPISILCARIYYVIFQWNELYAGNLSEIFAIRHGGLAIYGGVIGGVTTCAVYCKVKKLNVLAMMDIAGIGLMMGQCIGRWGNFVNCEAFGGDTTLPWRMCIGKTLAQSGAIGSHPTFFYESAWNAVGILLLHCFTKSRWYKHRGEGILGYFIWYGLGRFWIEGLRTDSLYLLGTGLRISQCLALASFGLALALFIINRKKPFLPTVQR